MIASVLSSRSFTVSVDPTRLTTVPRIRAASAAHACVAPMTLEIVPSTIANDFKFMASGPSENFRRRLSAAGDGKANESGRRQLPANPVSDLSKELD
ncbi:hypothetical protein [Mesorhizobium sp. CA4]|uniref:hypothetical protein n=1 Tax=Mesorhizobium sp. CA4 TaxID=588499 RepID=UPI001CD067F6|nr:hypothetical protein [Mesorhizobium sp. CA4]MBZ9821662.1 hypothetical protein [Mesorhizobium sp. CA4]